MATKPRDVQTKLRPEAGRFTDSDETDSAFKL